MNIQITHHNITVNREMPRSWGDVSFYNFLELAKLGDDVTKIISLFTKVPEEVLIKAKIENFDLVLESLSFIWLVKHEYYLPKTVLGYEIPKNLEFKSTGQYQDLKRIREELHGKDGVTVMLSYPLMVATYAMKDYSWEEAEKLQKVFFDAPCMEVLAVGNFTLLKLNALNESGKAIFQPVVILRNRLRLAIKSWLINLGSSARSITWKRLLSSAGMKSSIGR